MHREPELFLQRDADRLAPTTGYVEVRRLAARAVGDREEVVGGEGAERGQGDRDPDDRAEQDIGEVIDSEVDPQHAGDRDRTRGGDLAQNRGLPGTTSMNATPIEAIAIAPIGIDGVA